jgi:hypothetical protein
MERSGLSVSEVEAEGEEKAKSIERAIAKLRLVRAWLGAFAARRWTAASRWHSLGRSSAPR